MLFTDIHGHSINDNIFMYGNKGNTPEETENIKEIPNLMNQDLLFRVKERISRNKRSMLAWEGWAHDKCLIHPQNTDEVRLFTIGGWKFWIEK